MHPPLSHILADLVRLPSVNPMGRTDLPPEVVHESRVIAYLETLLRGLGCAVRRQPVAAGRDNLIATYTPPHPAPFTVLFEAHTDTVPVDGMTIPPFGANVEGGRLYGRGACDVKAGGVVMLAAFARLVREQPPGSAAVTLAFTVDEEHTFLGVQELVKEVTADYAVVAEPTLLNMVNAHKGVARWQVETAGVACHSSVPEKGVNAIYRMAWVLNGIEEYAERLRQRTPDPLLGPRTLSVGRVLGGASPNTVPDFCRIDVDQRFVPGDDPESAPAELEAFLQGYPGIDFPVLSSAPQFACPPLSAALSGPLVQRLGACINSVVGKHGVFAVPYGTDAATIALAGIPAVVFGPGDVAAAHTKDEWIDLSQLDPAAEILFRFACGK